jgi:cephalosporin hydroxylase
MDWKRYRLKRGAGVNEFLLPGSPRPSYTVADMRFTVDDQRRKLVLPDQSREIDLYSPEAFSILSRAWLRVGWDQKQVYSFTWLGRPIIQLPEDVLRIQEVLYTVKPDVIVETGVAHGGSLVLYASLCRAMGRGRVLGVDIEIRPHNRKAIESHELAGLITLIEGSSIASATIERVRAFIRPRETVFILLDSNHSKDHVLAELEAYGPLVTPGSYIVATDGSMEFLSDVPRGRPEWATDNPKAAALEFAARHPEFVLEEPAWRFNEGHITERVTHWPSCYLRRK